MGSYKIILKDLFLDTVVEVLYFPVWWYSRGLKKAALFCFLRFKDGWQNLALVIFIKNFFKPMYGQKGWDAYVLSLASHFIHLVFRLFLMFLWALLWVFILFAWVTLPIFTIWKLLF